MSSSQRKVYFHFLSSGFHFQKRTFLKTFIHQLFTQEAREISAINYIFCDDAYLLDLNKKYLQHNTYTDIITFELSTKEEPLIADIYISIDRVKENAKTFKTTIHNELLRVIFHGALHLCGFKDKTQSQAQQMRKKEEQYLGEWKFHVEHNNNKL